MLSITLNNTNMTRKTVPWVEERHKLIKLTLMIIFPQLTKTVRGPKTRMKIHKSLKKLEVRRSRAKVEQSSRSIITGIGLRSKSARLIKTQCSLVPKTCKSGSKWASPSLIRSKVSQRHLMMSFTPRKDKSQGLLVESRKLRIGQDRTKMDTRVTANLPLLESLKMPLRILYLRSFLQEQPMLRDKRETIKNQTQRKRKITSLIDKLLIFYV